jgi:glycosyltransferase involved in cell wall biosynthesis
MKKIKIGYIPFEKTENTYTERSIEILSRLGEVCKAPSLGDFIHNPLVYKPRSYDFIVVNWIENIIVNRKGNLSVFGIFKLILNILLIKLLSKKIIFVRHNNYPHNASPKKGPSVARIIDMVELFFDHSITHSGHNETKKRAYIPHPLYKHSNAKKKQNFKFNDYFLIFGRILPYKKIEKLIECIQSDIKLVIAGSSPDKAYVEKLQRLAIKKEIKIIPEFISDEEAFSLAQESRGIVMTHNDCDMIVSGTFFYALSTGVPIYCLSTPFIEWAEKTQKVPGLHVSNDIPSLCNKLEFDITQPQNFSARDQEKIEQLFGDVAIENKLSEIFITSNKNFKKDQSER